MAVTAGGAALLLGLTTSGGTAAASAFNPGNRLWTAVVRAMTKKKTVGFSATYQVLGGISASYDTTISMVGITEVDGPDSEFELTVPTVGVLHDLATRSMLYERLPSSLQEKVPGHKPWVAAAWSRLGGGSASSISSSPSPRALLALLEQTGNTDASAVPNGTATIGGVATIGFKAYLNLTAAARNSKGGVASSLEQAARETHSSILPISAWVDPHNLVRRMTMSLTIPPGAPLPETDTTFSSSGLGYNVQTTTTSPTTVNWSMNLYDYGAKVSFKPPPSSEVYVER
jgi:hypothetical protein